MSAAADTLLLTVAWFDTGMPKGPALGDLQTLTWYELRTIFEHHDVRAEKDGPCFVPARFKLEPDGRHVRRKGVNVIARTAIALDIETSKSTGEIPPTLDTAIRRAEALGLAAFGYNSHSHRNGSDRYRIVLPLAREVAPDLPAVEVIAERLGLLGVIDMGKRNPASVFYLPSRPYEVDEHEFAFCRGAPVDAARLETTAGKLLAARQAEADRIAALAQAEAAARREAKLAGGLDPDDSLIEKLRSRFDLDSVLLAHGYDKLGTRYRHPNSGSGSFGADIKVLGGIERVFSHNATDPLHASNLPGWCCGVTALDAFDVVVILDFAGDRGRAMRDLAALFNLTKKAEGRALARLVHRLIRQRASLEDIDAQAFSDGARLGLSRGEIRRILVWVARDLDAA